MMSLNNNQRTDLQLFPDHRHQAALLEGLQLQLLHHHQEGPHFDLEEHQLLLHSWSETANNKYK